MMLAMCGRVVGGEQSQRLSREQRDQKRKVEEVIEAFRFPLQPSLCHLGSHAAAPSCKIALSASALRMEGGRYRYLTWVEQLSAFSGNNIDLSGSSPVIVSGR